MQLFLLLKWKAVDGGESWLRAATAGFAFDGQMRKAPKGSVPAAKGIEVGGSFKGPGKGLVSE